ncbi:MAG TPA: hypothetical protein VGY57_04900, partial [Vicinamibacterales bacterium]|nr:hypothetical protein [Vicinamibacterales bacterium]
ATSLRLLPIVIAHAMGATLFLLWVPCVATALVMARRFRWTHAAILAVPVMIVALCWAIVPVNVDSRFMMPAVPFALLPFGFLFRTGRVTRNRVAGVALLAGMLWIVIGYRVELPVGVPWFMEGWLKLDGLVPSLYLTLFAPVAVGIALAWRVRPRWVDGTAAAVSLILAGGAIVAIDSAVRCPQTSPQTTCEYVWATSPRIRPELFDGWRWIGDHVSDATVAYTGMNLPYPLTGRRLTNRVVYANIDGRLRWRFHDYDRALRQNRFTPTPPLLATSSGELLPAVRDSAGGVDALRPRYERLQGIREAWENNLIQMHTRWLFIASLSAYERDYVWHDELDFPIEQTWAMADPAMFHLEYENPGVRVYSIRSFA